jgi:hypothetical protein
VERCYSLQESLTKKTGKTISLDGLDASNLLGLQGASSSYRAMFNLFEQGLRQMEQKTAGTQSTEF